MKPARTRRPPPPYSTSAYSEANKNPPSSPSLLNLSLPWSQQEPAVLHHLSQQWSQQEPAVLPLPTQPQPTVKPARTRRPLPPYSISAYREASMNLPPLPLPLLLNDSLQWSQREPATPFPPLLHNHSLHWSQHRTAIPPSLPSYPTIAYIEVSIDLPSPLPAYTTSAYSQASMNPPSPSHFSYKASDPVKPAWKRHLHVPLLPHKLSLQ